MKDLNRVLQFIKETLENIAKASVKAITGNIFTVKLNEKDVSVSNLPDVQKVSGDVSIVNLKDYEAKLESIRGSVVDLGKSLEKAIAGSKVEKVTVSNLKEVVIPSEVVVKNQVKQVEVSNLDAIYGQLKKISDAIKDLPQDYPEFPKIPEFKIPEFPKFPKIPDYPKEMQVKDLEKLVKQLSEVFNTDADKYLTVRLSDGKKFYEAITEVVASSGMPYTTAKGSRSQALIDDQRRQVVVVGDNDPLLPYKISDMDTASDPVYFGYVDKDGGWYIMKKATNTIRYVAGTSAYTTNWSNRASLTYKLFNQVF